MKIEALIGDEKRVVEIRRADDGSVKATVDGRAYNLEVSEPEPGVFVLKHNHRIHQFYVAPAARGEANIVSSAKRDIEIKLVDPKSLRASEQNRSSAEGSAEVKTNMPGKVVRIVAEPGTQVEKGDPVIVVEAMKMQNDLKAPRTGTVKEIRTKEGETVSAGDVLAIVE